MADTFTQALIVSELSATPTLPASGYRKIYPKADGFLYQLTAGGVETQLDNIVASTNVYTVISVTTATFTITQTTGTYIFLVNATTAPIAIALPVASNSTAVYIIKKVDATVNTVTITPTTSSIEGATNALIKVNGASITVVSNGTNYFIT